MMQRTIAAVMAVLILTGAGEPSGRVAASRGGVSSQVAPPTCAWRNVFSATQGTLAFPEGNATTWTTYFYANKALLLHIRGQFPHARYMSLTVQPVTFGGGGSVTFGQQGGERLYDAQIKPNPGSRNPFWRGASRSTTRRSYDVWIRFQPRASTTRTNAMYGGSSGYGALSYRVYAPDFGRGPTGGVALPTVDKVVLLAGGTKSHTLHVPLCATSPLHAVALSQQLSASMSAAPPATWQHSFATGRNASSGVPADYYQGFDVLAARVSSGPGLVVVHFKAPTFARTYFGSSITGREQVRYWSLCSYTLSTGQLAGCVDDQQAHLDSEGYATVVVASLADRVKVALRNANWLPAATGTQSVLVYRQLLPSGTFAEAVLRAPDDTAGMKSHMGDYFPNIASCTPTQWRVRRCAGG